ncbi:zinc-dependent alcohol dehydrogenase family protein [Kribbella sp. VKM Ac-2566]|uniref:zinc-dependent alcohol dehydrogenase family protein n=1 Tax=Kribbella sp. VKM Ac-2566 TaxID=2512218 RepID=UPI0021070521|nr:zinc-dependent alcohol dehydrogenase family protein [Kribbella sp. VKM Ac-2566]
MGASPPFARSEPLHIEHVELAPPGPGEALVEVAFAGLCHSDLSVIDGSRPRVVPMVLGHEASGIVRECGPGVDTVQVGDHVVFSYVPLCGRCSMCEAGRGSLCERGSAANAKGTLLSGQRRFSSRDGKGTISHHLGVSAFSQFTVAAQESLVKIDRNTPLEVAAVFGCAVLTGVGAVVNTARLAAGSSAAVFGLGGVGLSAVLGAYVAGADPLVAVDVLPGKLDLARQLGATHTVNASETDAMAAVREITGGGATFVFEGVGSEHVLAQAYQATARGGTTVTMGLPHPDRLFSIPAVTLVAEERTVKGSYMGSALPRRDVPAFMALHRSGRLPVDALITGRLALDDINAGFDRLADGQAVRQLVDFSLD